MDYWPWRSASSGDVIIQVGQQVLRKADREPEHGSTAEDRLSALAAGVRPSMQEIVAIAAGHGIEILPPEKQS